MHSVFLTPTVWDTKRGEKKTFDKRLRNEFLMPKIFRVFQI